MQKNQAFLKSHPNLIIDIRNNGGVADRSFKEILPYIYTNPIRSTSVEWLSTESSQKLVKQFSETIPEDKTFYKNALKRMIGNEGKFVRLTDEAFTVYKFRLFSISGVLFHNYVLDNFIEAIWCTGNSKTPHSPFYIVSIDDIENGY